MPPKLLLSYALLLVACSALTCYAMTPQMMSESRRNVDKFHEIRLAEAIKKSTNMSNQCTQALVYFVTSNNSALLKAYVDAMGKPGSGISIGNLNWFGSYSQCTAIPGASYCLASLAPNVKNGSSAPPPNPLFGTIKWGLCVPKQCSETDVAIGLQDIFKAFGLDAYLHLAKDQVMMGGSMPKSVNCAKPSEYTGGVIATITLCGALLFLCLCGTILEIVSSYKVHVKKTDGFVPITNESPAEQQEDSFTARDSDHGSNQHLGAPTYSREELRKAPIIQRQTGFVEEFFLCFSLIRNTNHIMNTDVPANAITSINGMRVLSILWVVLGHTYSFQFAAGLINGTAIIEVIQRFSFQVIIAGVFAVDSFFFLSGLLVAYLSFRQMDKTKGSLNWFKFYFHRFWRLTPVYMFVLLFYDQMTGFLGEGPVWYQAQAPQPCDKYWWTNLLYINNFYPLDMSKSCMGWAWYLANDMQFFIISPVIIIAAHRFGKPGLGIVVSILLAASFISTGVITGYYDLGASILGDMANTNEQAHFMKYVYVKPYCRIAPYLVGMVLGYLLHAVRSNEFRSPTKVVLVIGWCAAIILATAPVFGTYKTVKKHPEPFTKTENITYAMFSRFSWSLALAWVIYACHTGNGGLVDKILSARFWIPLSRLTYCVYLVHIVVLEVYFMGSLLPNYYSDINSSWHFLACSTVSYLIAYIVSVTCEVPMMQLEKIFFKTDRKKH